MRNKNRLYSKRPLGLSLVVIGLLCVFAQTPWARAAEAKSPTKPTLAYVFPAGGRVGTTFECTLGGQAIALNDEDLEEARIHISGSGVTAIVHPYYLEYALAQKRVSDLDMHAGATGGRENLALYRRIFHVPESVPFEKLENDYKEWASVQWLSIHEWSNKAYASVWPHPGKRSGSDKEGVSQTFIIQVTVTPDAVAGKRELRLETPAGISNPWPFFVQAQLPEFSRDSATFASLEGDKRDRREYKHPPSGFMLPEMELQLPALVNGQIMRGEIQRYRFRAKKGQRIVIAVSARELIPFLTDAVPGFTQAILELYDNAGRQLAHVDNYRFNPDPVLCQEIPADGEYQIRVYDALYRGRENFVYRLSVGELPWVTDIFPLGGRTGTQTPLEVRGWNLPTGKFVLDTPNKTPGIHPLGKIKPAWFSDQLAVAIDDLPECRATKTNHSRASAQPVAVPVIVNGRLERPGEWDVFRFEGRAGQEVVAEIMARRLGSPLDSGLYLTDAAGKQLAANDDYEPGGLGLNRHDGLTTHFADSYLRLKLPADGMYFIHVGDVQRRAGPEYAYRLRLDAPHPDFELRLAPSTLNVAPGETAALTAYAVRRDGFVEDIELSLKGAPEGMKLVGATILPGGQNVVQLKAIVPSPSTAALTCFTLSLQGRCRINGQPVVRQAVPVEDIQSAFIYQHLVPYDRTALKIAGKP